VKASSGRRRGIVSSFMDCEGEVCSGERKCECEWKGEEWEDRSSGYIHPLALEKAFAIHAWKIYMRPACYLARCKARRV